MKSMHMQEVVCGEKRGELDMFCGDVPNASMGEMTRFWGNELAGWKTWYRIELM